MQEERLSTKPLQDYIFYSKYSRTYAGRKENWTEAIDRVMDTHWSFYEHRGINMDLIKPYFDEAYEAYQENYAIGAQRILQWGGEQLIKHKFKAYNCSSSYANRVKFFQELFYILLCGAGAGYSVQKIHTNMLPKVKGALRTKTQYIISDNIEGWAGSTGALISSHFYGTEKPDFYYGNIREKGSFISGGFKAPGPDPLEKCHKRIDKILVNAAGRRLTPFEVHRIACIIADAVISGGVRRSALLVLFDADDNEMMTCKTGDWQYQYPELARANNSVVILPDTSKEVFEQAFSYVREYGEPGFAFLNNPWQCFNPCFEVGMMPMLFKNSEWTLEHFQKWLPSDDRHITIEDIEMYVEFGWSTCNLSEVNGVKIKTVDELKKAVRAATILGTLQAGYDTFPFLGSVTEQIVQRDALIGVSFNSMASNPRLFFDPIVQKEMAEVVKQVNEEVAEILGINFAARTTVIKPSGNSSQMQGGAPGIHAFNSPAYIRNVQANKMEQSALEYQKVNPDAVQQSVWTDTDLIVSFPIEVPHTALFKDDITARDFLENVKLTQQNWILNGTNIKHSSYAVDPTLSHNVSNTCNIDFEIEGDSVKEYLWYNRRYFTGISLLPKSGDVDFPQAPYQEILNPVELAEIYGDAAILGSGLVVDAIHEFGDLWVATDTALGKGLSLEITVDDLTELITDNLKPNGDTRLKFELKIDGVMVTDINALMSYLYNRNEDKKEWVGRFKRFAKKYLKGDENKCAECLKRISLYHKWVHLRKPKAIDWNDIEWEDPLKDAGDDTAQNCSGGACLL